MELRFFFRVKVSPVKLDTMDLLSQQTLAVPLRGIPNTLSLYLMDSIRSTAILIAMNSELNMDDYCAWQNHRTGAHFKQMSIPVSGNLVIWLPP
jgi:hypothetical protein